MGTCECIVGVVIYMYLQCFFVDFFVDAGPLSPDPTLVGKKLNPRLVF